VPDGEIAAIALARGLAVATRNLSDFEECGLELVDPFR
jgi:predicted nucleic acid-binding protein